MVAEIPRLLYRLSMLVRMVDLRDLRYSIAVKRVAFVVVLSSVPSVRMSVLIVERSSVSSASVLSL